MHEHVTNKTASRFYGKIKKKKKKTIARRKSQVFISPPPSFLSFHHPPSWDISYPGMYAHTNSITS